jgi:hypothetical protein
VAIRGCRTEDCLGHAEYSSSASSTFVNLGQAVDIQYGRGSASGTAVQDAVTIGACPRPAPAVAAAEYAA